MLKYILKRIAAAIVTILISSSLLFFLVQVLPGKPYDSNKLDPQQIADKMDELDMDEPLMLRYSQFIIGILGFESDIEDGTFVEGSIKYKVIPQFGYSWDSNGAPVNETLLLTLPISMRVGFQAIIFGTIVGLLFGIVAGLYKNRFPDHILTFLAVVGISVPSFVFASLLIYIFGDVLYGKLPFDIPFKYNQAHPFSSTILPTIALSLYIISTLTRYMRSELVEVFSSDYILLAKAKGIKHRSVIFRHSIRNALIPVITVIGPLFLALLTGSMVIESAFGIPGMGGLMLDAITKGDHPTILGLAFYYTTFYIIVVLLVDLSYGLIDPRIRIAGGES